MSKAKLTNPRAKKIREKILDLNDSRATLDALYNKEIKQIRTKVDKLIDELRIVQRDCKHEFPRSKRKPGDIFDFGRGICTKCGFDDY